MNEYEGGHIKSALNLFTHELIRDFFFPVISQPPPLCDSPRHDVYIFHCEFSSERAPRLLRYVRSMDRQINQDHYPRLSYPELYILEGGYKNFFEEKNSYCDPPTYRPMLDKQFKPLLGQFRMVCQKSRKSVSK